MCVTILLAILHGFAALIPLFVRESAPPDTNAFGGWPQQFEAAPLLELRLTEQEQTFVQGFPGRIARFTDGSREIIIRWINLPSRSLHPASDCLKGVGYRVSPRPLRVDADGHHWGCFAAKRDVQTLSVCERVYDDTGGSWSDVSSWYWAAILGKTHGPWWAITVAEKGGQ